MTSRRALQPGRPGLLVTAVGLVGALCLGLWAARESGFPYWDFAWYQEQTFQLADSFARSSNDGWRSVGRSLAEDYNLLFAVPLVPWVMVLGDQRLVYLLAVYFTYFFSFLFLLSLVGRRLTTDSSGDLAGPTAAAVLLTPACWTHVLQGYPDVAGAAAMAGCVLLHGTRRRTTGARAVAACAGLGLLAGMAVSLRRHYVYAVAALFGALMVEAAGKAWIGRGSLGRGTRTAREATGLLVAGALAVVVIALLSPKTLTRAAALQTAMAPWQETPLQTANSLLGSLGLLPLLLASAGWVVAATRGELREPEARVVLLATFIWTGLWLFHARQQPFHYPHWAPQFVALGLALGWLSARRLTAPSHRRTTLVFACLILAAAIGVQFFPSSGSGRRRSLPLRILPDPMQTVENPARAAIEQLVEQLRKASAAKDPIFVAAASHVLNPDIVRSAERAIHGRDGSRLQVMHSAQVDSMGLLPADDLLRAAIVVLTTPPQLSLRPADQRVVTVLTEAFDKNWPVAADFRRLPETISLPHNGGRITLYRRDRLSSPETALDTLRRMEEYVTGGATATAVWTVESSPYPASALRLPDGTYRLTGHPTRRSDSIATRFRMAFSSGAALVIRGTVQFFDHRCPGVQLVLTFGGDSRYDEIVAGTFHAEDPSREFSASLPKNNASEVWMDLRSHPDAPDSIDFCTLTLDRISLGPAFDSDD